MKCFRQIVKAWNKQAIGNLETNIEQVEKEIELVQGSVLVDPHNVTLQNKNLNLSQKLDQMLKLEEIKWVQKSRQNWTQLGDINN